MVISLRTKRVQALIWVGKEKVIFHSLHGIKRETVFPVINLCRGDGGEKLNMLPRERRMRKLSVHEH